MYENRTLVRGDNLEEMRRFPDACIDLIATDPPFNSKRDYFVPSVGASSLYRVAVQLASKCNCQPHAGYRY